MSTKTTGRGRPRKRLESVKSASLLLRMEPREKKGFTDAADLAGVPLTVWIRERLRQAAVRELDSAARPIPFLDHLQAD